MDKAVVVFEKLGKYKWLQHAGDRAARWIKRKEYDTLKPIGVKNTPIKQRQQEFQNIKTTWTGGKRPVSPPDKGKLKAQLAADRYLRQFGKIK